ncbi:hypothetical protein HAX54_049810, partial [Datura stramonium]|nr:hypothetical protein [Datura stramonium]
RVAWFPGRSLIGVVMRLWCFADGVPTVVVSRRNSEAARLRDKRRTDERDKKKRKREIGDLPLVVVFPPDFYGIEKWLEVCLVVLFGRDEEGVGFLPEMGDSEEGGDAAMRERGGGVGQLKKKRGEGRGGD